jgi:hypothetical protein
MMNDKEFAEMQKENKFDMPAGMQGQKKHLAKAVPVVRDCFQKK